MGMTFTDAKSRATKDGVTDYEHAWAIATRSVLLFLARTDEVDNGLREGYADWVDDLMAPTTHDEFWARASAIRDKVIEEHQDSNICEDGSNKFLEWLGLDPIEVKRDYRVTVQVTLTFDVSGTTSDEEYIRNDVDRYLRLNASGMVDNADLYNAQTSIDSVEVEESDY